METRDSKRLAMIVEDAKAGSAAMVGLVELLASELIAVKAELDEAREERKVGMVRISSPFGPDDTVGGKKAWNVEAEGCPLPTLEREFGDGGLWWMYLDVVCPKTGEPQPDGLGALGPLCIKKQGEDDVTLVTAEEDE